jgi:hypothetical protein
MLRNRFVCGYRNIYNEPYAGNSAVHPMESVSVDTTNGAGPHNVQLFVLSDDGTVLHCMPGYWNAEDMASELALAEKLNSVWRDTSISREQKEKIFQKMNKEHLASHSSETIARSHLQGFDAQYIAEHQAELPDLIQEPALLKGYKPSHGQSEKEKTEGGGSHLNYEAFKTTDKIMHERLGKQPFVAYSDFDIGSFTNYGTNYYDKGESHAEGAVTRVELKNLDLHRNTFATCVIAKPTAKPAAAAADPQQTFSELAGKGKFTEALACADKIVKSQPNKPTGYELRAKAGFELKLYLQAYNDANRAAWLGSRDPHLADLRNHCKQWLDRKERRAMGSSQTNLAMH